MDPSLHSATHVFLRIDAVKRPLVPPYEGPFAVVGRAEKTFVILRKGNEITVSIDRLKPAYSLPLLSPGSSTDSSPVSLPSSVLNRPDPGCRPSGSPSRPPAAVAVPAASPAPPLDPSAWPLPTRFGRRPRPPDRLNI